MYPLSNDWSFVMSLYSNVTYKNVVCSFHNSLKYYGKHNMAKCNIQIQFFGKCKVMWCCGDILANKPWSPDVNVLVSSHLSEICFTWRNQHVVTFTPPLENIQAFKLSSTVGKFMKASNFPTLWCHSSPTVQLRERDDTLPIVTFEL